MPSIYDAGYPKDEVEKKVLRRARIAKMTRALQDRLALANIKFQHGWQHRSLESIEPELEFELKRKRPNSSGELFSGTSSTSSTQGMMLSSSPITDHPLYSDEVVHNLRSASSHSSKRFKGSSGSNNHAPQSKPVRPARPAARTWKSDYALAQSSPIKHHHNRSRPSLSAIPNFSFPSETDTVMDRSPSEDDDEDLPIQSFQMPATTNISSSPPRTPPPDLARSARLRSKGFDANDTPVDTSFAGGKEGADLLLYLAASPSPAVPANRSRALDAINAPSTPPSKHTPLPSSMMTTPGTANLLGFNLATPGPNFNFSDFVNVTPSPAQNTWSKTPNASKTPLAALEARRRLNFDGFVPHSPQSSRRDRGLGMELGGELIP